MTTWFWETDPGICEPEVELPDWWRERTRDADLLPPIPPPPPPEPPPIPPGTGTTLAVAAAVAITTAMRDDDDCEEGCEKCIPLHAGAGGIPKRMPYANERNSRVGYEYQHHVVNWFFHDPIARIIMEWEFNGVEFDGLDPTRGTLLAGRGIARAEYDPAGVARCYLIDTKYGYEIYVRYDAWEERWVVRQLFFWGGWQKELTGQSDAIESSHPNVMLIWIFSNLQVMQVAKEVLNEVSQGKVATVYYSYIAQEDRAE